MREKKPVSILTYHSIGRPLDPYTISPEAFARHVRFIRDRYTVLPLQDIAGYLEDERPDSRAVVITFDDAFLDFYEVAYPILRKSAIPCTVFVPSGLIGESNEWDADGDVCHRKPLMRAGHLRELHKAGLASFGSHTVDHVRMTLLSPREMRRQAADSKAALEDVIGAKVTMFAYPYGQLDDFSDTTATVLAKTGYTIAVTSHWGTCNSLRDILRLKRIFFTEGDSDWVIGRKIEGWYDWMALKERAGFTARTLKKMALGRPQSGLDSSQ